MLLSEIKDWLKTKINCPNWYVGKIDGSVEQCIGIYSIVGGKPNIAVGGLENTSYATKSISILVQNRRHRKFIIHSLVKALL